MNKIQVIGLTGPTGSGKSTLAQLFSRRKLPVIDADALARQVTAAGSPVLAELAGHFGAEILHPDGSLNRRALAAAAFSSPGKTALLNSVTHPAVIRLAEEQIAAYAAEGVPAVVLDAPLLYESGADKICDTVIAVLAPPGQRLSRIMARDSLTEQQALLRMKAGQPDRFYLDRTGNIVYNEGNLSDFLKQMNALLDKLENN